MNLVQKGGSAQPDLFDLATGRQVKVTNKLIWGDNKFILSSLKTVHYGKKLRNGGIKLIYIDPFDVGADFTMDVEIGGETLEKAQMYWRNCLQDKCKSKTFLAMIYDELN